MKEISTKMTFHGAVWLILPGSNKIMIIGGFLLMMNKLLETSVQSLEWAHNSIKAIQSLLVKFLWLSTEINIILSHLNICVHFAVGVLQTPWQAQAKTHLCKRQHKRKMAYKQLRTEIMGQNPESKQAIKNMSMQSMLPDVVCGKWSEGKSTHTLSLCYKQRIMPWLGFTCI